MNKPTALPVRAKQNSAKQAKPTPSSLNGKTPTSKTSDVEVETQGDDILLSFGGVRRYRIRGLEKNHSSQQLKVNFLACREDGKHSYIERPTGADPQNKTVRGAWIETKNRKPNEL